MPSTYAHYRFGADAIPTLPRSIQLSIGRFRRLYDVGLHGPDPFFHYNVLWNTEVGGLGNSMHELTGEAFFTQVCKRYRMHPSEGGRCFLYGFLAHYALDSMCHPFINRTVDQGEVGHIEMESEFERFLLDLDGKKPPNRQDVSGHLKLTRSESDTAAELLHPVTAGQFRQAVRHMHLNFHLLGTVNPRLVHWFLLHFEKEIADQMIPEEPNRKCAYLDGRLYDLYQQALTLYPSLVRQMDDHIEKRTPFGEDFQKTFG